MYVLFSYIFTNPLSNNKCWVCNRQIEEKTVIYLFFHIKPIRKSRKMSDSKQYSPANWSVVEVTAWAAMAGLSSEIIETLEDNEIDGPVLLTLSRDDLKNEIGIKKLSTRRYFWDSLEKLRSQQNVSDYNEAVILHENEVINLEDFVDASEFDPYILDILRDDIHQQKQIVEDSKFAHTIEGNFSNSQQRYDDAEIAVEEQCNFDRLRLQEDYDHAYALTLMGEREARDVRRQQEQNQQSGEVKSLMRLSIDSCVKNRINVAEALKTRNLPLSNRKQDFLDTSNHSRDIGIKKTDHINLPRIRCHVCFEVNVPGFELPCTHGNCQECMTKLLHTALQDSSLLPLRCCELPIDMNVAEYCLSTKDISTLTSRVVEIEAKNKMYCPSCNQFINLDLISMIESNNDFICMCGTTICIQCKTVSHAGISCTENQSKSEEQDAQLLELAKEKKWQSCPGCSSIVELISGCNHITCSSCQTEFCYQCRSLWDNRTGNCSSGTCDRWEEENLLERGEERVQARERALGRAFRPAERQNALNAAMRVVDENEVCRHDWVRRSLHGECERCGFTLRVYGMVCRGTCRSTVCYTCARHRLPRVGWR